MGSLQLLDCTLRDGGYLNDWKFGRDNITSIFERVVDAGIDIIEIGFLDDRRDFDYDRSIMPNTDCVEKIYGDLKRKQAMVVGMIDYGTCDLKNIKPCTDSFLDGMRVIFKKHLRREALNFCAELKKLGYKVFAQLVSVTSYSDEEMLDLIQLANEIEPYAVSMVDTYGLMHQDNLIHYVDLLDKGLLPDIKLGYHAHNNFQMGYANCMAMLAYKTERGILVDGTIYGMGKSAGNAPIELIMMHMNHKYNKHYHISQILEAIDSNISQFYQSAAWGYNMFFFLAASNDCHPSYVSYLMNKKTLSVKSINEILSKLQGEKKLFYDEIYIENLYIKYQSMECNDSQYKKRLCKELTGKDILLVAPGSSVKGQRNIIQEYIDDEKPIIISVNFIPEDINPQYLFMSNSKRYVQMAGQLSKAEFRVRTIATSNITKANGNFDYMINYSSLLDVKAIFADNPLIMVLKLLLSFKVKSIALAGFDGYTKGAKPDYVNPTMAYSFSKSKAEIINSDVIDSMKRLNPYIFVKYVTDSVYNV